MEVLRAAPVHHGCLAVQHRIAAAAHYLRAWIEYCRERQAAATIQLDKLQPQLQVLKRLCTGLPAENDRLPGEIDQIQASREVWREAADGTRTKPLKTAVCRRLAFRKVFDELLAADLAAESAQDGRHPRISLPVRGDIQLEAKILLGLKEFFLIEEQRSELAKTEQAPGKAADTPTKREMTVMGSMSQDDATSRTTQRFAEGITRIVLASQDDLAFLATEVLASINRQGIVHPKETGVMFMTLEASPIAKFAEVAYLGHKMLHEKHESAVKREYG